jgi:DNA-binding response OmpR family regulator
MKENFGESAAEFLILLIEDQIKHQLLYKETLTAALPVTVVCAATGKDGLAVALGKKTPDLVILDLELPESRGEDVLAKMRDDHRLRHVPVMILTGLSSTEKQLELLDKGADDFIEKGAPPEIIIARVKSQMRHKIALDRLTKMALDRDLFAAGVLKDIGSVRSTVAALCSEARDLLNNDPANHKAELSAAYQKLSAHATKLGAYASDVIQSVRESRREPKMESQQLPDLMAWVFDVISSGEGAKKISVSSIKPLLPVMADKNFLRLALLNILQHAQRQANAIDHIQIDVTQMPTPADPKPEIKLDRPMIRTLIRDHGRSPSPGSLATLFQPYVRADDPIDQKTDMGFGLGLSLVAKVMAMMGGRVGAEKPASTGEAGTVIWFDLPGVC